MTPTETPTCPYCSSEAERLNAEYLKCPACNFYFVERLPTDDELVAAYGGDFFKRLRRRILAPFRTMRSQKNLAFCRGRASRILSLVTPRLAGRTSVRHLDVGCNKGYLLEESLNQGYEPWGVEFAAEVIAPFLNTYPATKPHVFCGSFPEAIASLDGESFDLVTAIDVIEHFFDLRGGMGRLHELLKPGGFLLIRTPDTDSKDAREMGTSWGALKAVEHLTLVSSSHLEELTRSLGFSAYERLDEVVDDEDSNVMVLLTK